MNKKIIITALLVLVALAGQAQETVWNNVVAGYNNTQRTVSVTKVDFQADRTDVRGIFGAYYEVLSIYVLVRLNAFHRLCGVAR